jgi:hypothetical protein
VLIGITLAGDGRANWFKGAQLVGFYLILAALFYCSGGGGVTVTGSSQHEARSRSRSSVCRRSSSA